MAELQLSLLGKLQISLDGAPVRGFASAKAQALLCYLAVTGRPHERESLAALFWGDVPETEARASLRTVLANLRKLVGAQILAQQGRFYFRLTWVGQAEELLQKSLPLLKQLGVERELALALFSLGLIGWAQGQYEPASQHFEASLALAQAAGQPLLAAVSRCWLGNLAHSRGEHSQAEQLLRQSLPVLRKIGKLTGLGTS